MSLRCTVCRSPIDEGLNFCPNCRTGFVSQLECDSCRRSVPRGSASCVGCLQEVDLPPTSRALDVCQSSLPLPSALVSLQSPLHAPSAIPGLPPHVSLVAPVASTFVSLQSPLHAPPAIPGLPPHVSLAAPVASTFVSRQGGVEAEVRIPPGDAGVMDLMGQLVVILHTFAAKMNTLTGHGELTRHIIRSARVLATDVQEELEQRKGPGR